MVQSVCVSSLLVNAGVWSRCGATALARLEAEYDEKGMAQLRLSPISDSGVVVDIDDPEGPGGERLGEIEYEDFLAGGDADLLRVGDAHADGGYVMCRAPLVGARLVEHVFQRRDRGQHVQQLVVVEMAHPRSAGFARPCERVGGVGLLRGDSRRRARARARVSEARAYGKRHGLPAA